MRESGHATCPEGPIKAPSEREFELLTGLIRREGGINLSPAKKALLAGRLGRRVRELGLASFGEYYDLVTKKHPGELVELLDRICTNETQFFREPRQFDFVREHVIPAWRLSAARGLRTRSIKIWSAACSTGQEPYSLAMLLLDQLCADPGWNIEIEASDLSTRALAVALRGVWPLERASEIPPGYLRRFMLKGVRAAGGQMAAGPLLRSVLRFRRANLIDPGSSVSGRFDAVFCRNVLIYFDRQTKQKVLGHLIDRLADDGYLFLGHAESIQGLQSSVVAVGPMVYRKKGPGVAGGQRGSLAAARSSAFSTDSTV